MKHQRRDRAGNAAFPKQSRADHYQARIQRVAAMERPDNIEFVARLTVLLIGLVAGAYALDMWLLLLWYPVYGGVELLERFAVRRGPPETARMRYMFLHVTNSSISMIWSSLLIYLWFTGEDIAQFGAAILLVGMVLHVVLQRWVDPGVLMGDSLPICIALYAIAASFWLIDGQPGLAIAATVGVTCLSLYFALALHQMVSQIRLTEDLQAERFRASKNASIGQLTGGIAHDFNNLLTVANGNLELYGLTVDGDERDRYVKEAFDAIARGKQLTRNLLSYAGRTTLMVRPTNPSELLLGVRPLLTRTLPESIRLTFDIEDGLPEVLLDPVQCENALLNLAINSRDAMPDGGVLDISAAIARGVDTQPCASGRQIEPGQYLAIEIRDNGIGMDAETARNALEPYFTTKPSGSGSGLGLSSVLGFVRQSGGYLTINTARGEGTQVKMLFPL